MFHLNGVLIILMNLYNMKKKDLKLFKPFINNNGYLSIVYKVTKNSLLIMNYNGSVYSLTQEDKNELNYRDIDISAEEFFSKFPKSNLHYSHRDALNQAIKDFHNENHNQKKQKIIINPLN